MTRKTLFIALMAILCTSLYAQESFEAKQERRRKAKELLQSNPDFIKNYYQENHLRKLSPAQMEALRKNVPVGKGAETKSAANIEMPEKFWYPGEFEEVQAILITWPYMTVAEENVSVAVDPVDETYGYSIKNGYIDKIHKYINIFNDSDTDTRLPAIFAELADAIQRGNAEVWINIFEPEDSIAVKNYMAKKGKPLTNYRFFVNQGNSFWYRDCGPVGFYYGDNDDIAFMDFEYYGGRPMDDLIPKKIGEQIEVPVYTTSFEYEGGNIIVDGAGTLFTSDMLYSANMDTYGLFYMSGNQLQQITKKALTRAQIQDTLVNLFGLEHLEILPTLQYDGGTGHIDLYAAMWDENNFVFTQYPDELSRLTDYGISKKNIDKILTIETFHGDKTYRGRNIPLPKKDNGTWYTSNNDFARYTRTYSNSTFVNNVIIQPIFSSDEFGDKEWDNRALEIMKRQFPGYEIIPIDIRGFQSNLYTGFDGSGGAIHCITKQIPAENPIRILHSSIQGFANDYNGVFPIEATITNKSGIESATCFWRIKGQSEWNALSLESGANNLFSASLARNTNIANETIEYYISATSNNGKTITKPFTAPQGYYSFYYGTEAVEEIPEDIYAEMNNTGIETEENAINDNSSNISNFYPNPANNQVKLHISGMSRNRIIMNMINAAGQSVYANTFVPDGDMVVLDLNVSSFEEGIYYVIFTDNSGNKTSRSLIIRR